jgi:Zn-dependent protease
MWAGTRVAISVWFVLAAVVLCLQLQSLWLGLMATGVLVVSVLLHEMAHVWVARGTGGWCDDILAWPLGGLVAAQPELTRRSQVLTALAGPAVHALVCLVTGVTVWRAGLLPEALNPLSGWPTVGLSGGVDAVRSVIVLLFTINWALLVINLLPVHPFDGGRVLESMLSEWLVEETAADLYLRLGALLGVALLAAGMLADQPLWHGTWLVGLGAVVLVLNLEEIAGRRAVDDLETALLEYELALDDEVEEYEPIETQEGLLERWRQRREESRVQEEQGRQQEVEHQVDLLLKKIHQNGFEGLSEDEKRQLRQASRQYRQRTPRPEETV